MLSRDRARQALASLLLASLLFLATCSPFQNDPSEASVVRRLGTTGNRDSGRSQKFNTILSERVTVKNGQSTSAKQLSVMSYVHSENQIRAELTSPGPEDELQTPNVRQIRPVTPQLVNPDETPTRAKGYTASETNCPNCLLKKNVVKSKPPTTDADEMRAQRTLEEELEKMRIEEIKSKILKKLRMVSRPTVTIPRSMLPEPLQGGQLQYLFEEKYHQNLNVEDDYYGKTEKVIVIAENVEYPMCNAHHSEPAACFDFKLAKNVFNKDVSSAELWVYKLRDKRDNYNQTYVVSELPSPEYNLREQNSTVAMRDVSIKNGWIKFDLTVAVRRWLRKSNASLHGLRINCKTCVMNLEDHPVSNDPGEKPFIVINFATPEVLRRGKRSIDCQPNTTLCCKESFYVNFTDIGWGDWVISPQGYHANYCKGSCMEDITSTASHHATVIQEYLRRNKSTMSRSKVSQLMPCCTPIKTGPISIIYTQDDNSTVVYNTLPNMMVDACGCK